MRSWLLLSPLGCSARSRFDIGYGVNDTFEAPTAEAISNHGLPLSVAPPVNQLCSRVGQREADSAFQSFLPAGQFSGALLTFHFLTGAAFRFAGQRALSGFEKERVGEGRRDTLNVVNAALFFERLADLGFDLGLELRPLVENVTVEPLAPGNGRELGQVHVRRQPKHCSMAVGFAPGSRHSPPRTRPLVVCSSISLRVAAFHLPLRMTPGRLCHKWSGKLMINWTSFSAGPSDSAILRASSGVRLLITHLLLYYVVRPAKS